MQYSVQLVLEITETIVKVFVRSHGNGSSTTSVDAFQGFRFHNYTTQRQTEIRLWSTDREGQIGSVKVGVKLIVTLHVLTSI